jgi:rubrerythrin
MSGRGEKPDFDDAQEALELSIGETLYNEEGDPVGTIRGIEESGAYVTTRDDVEALSIEHARSGQSFGEAELMWRCMECGEMGEIEGGLPDKCPSCESPKEDLMYWTED